MSEEIETPNVESEEQPQEETNEVNEEVKEE